MLVGGRFGSIQARPVKRTHKWVCHVVPRVPERITRPDERLDSSQVELGDRRRFWNRVLLGNRL